MNDIDHGFVLSYIMVITVFTINDKNSFCLYHIMLIAGNIANTMYIGGI
jgi:hypothetical protein